MDVPLVTKARGRLIGSDAMSRRVDSGGEKNQNSENNEVFARCFMECRRMESYISTHRVSLWIPNMDAQLTRGCIGLARGEDVAGDHLLRGWR